MARRGAKATLKAKGNGQYVYNVDEFRYSGTFFRITTRRPPHNLYTTGAKLRATGKHAGAKDQAYKPVWKFAPDAPLEARPYGGTITVTYPDNTIRYAYDRTTNTYLRSVTGEKKQTDAATGVRIAPKNVVVMRMHFGPLNDGHPGAPRLEADVVGSGTAWISTNGRTIKGTWKKTAVTKPTKFYDAQRQGGHADHRPDLRPGRAGRATRCRSRPARTSRRPHPCPRPRRADPGGERPSGPVANDYGARLIPTSS